MAYTKADFYAAYGVYAVDPETGARYAQFRSPDVCGGQPVTLLLHYHPAVMVDLCRQRADRLLQYFEKKQNPVAKGDRLLLLGGAFGWTGEALEDLVPGLSMICVEPSEYIHQLKGESPDDELIEAIEAQGYSLLGEVGQYLYQKFSQSESRSRDPGKVQDLDLCSPAGMEQAASLLGGVPTHVITEEVWQILSDQERAAYNAVFDSWGADVAHYIQGAVV